MNRYFISDLHLDETRPHTTALFQSFVEKLKENDPQTELYILGSTLCNSSSKIFFIKPMVLEILQVVIGCMMN